LLTGLKNGFHGVVASGTSIGHVTRMGGKAGNGLSPWRGLPPGQKRGQVSVPASSTGFRQVILPRTVASLAHFAQTFALPSSITADST